MQVDIDQSNTVSYSFELRYLMHFSIRQLVFIRKVFFHAGYINIYLAYGLFS